MSDEYKELKEQAVDNLLSVLTEGGVITESYAKRLPLLAEIEYGDESLLESVNVHDSSPQTVQFYGLNRVVKLEDFYAAWNKLGNDTAVKIMNDLVGGSGSAEKSTRQQANKIVRTLIEWFNLSIKKSNPHKFPPLPKDLGSRKDLFRLAREYGYTTYTEMWDSGILDYDPSSTHAVFSKHGARASQGMGGTGDLNRRDEEDDLSQVFGNQYSKADEPIVRGQRGPDHSRSGRTAQKINDMDLMAGELYTNISRIPKPSAFRWANLFKKEVQRFGLDADKKGGVFKSKTWKKVFIMGYQIEDKTLFEIWYNTIDSSYTLHDFFGNTIGKRYPTMNEAVRRLMFATVKFSKDDVDFFKNPANRSVADSFFRPLISDTDDFIRDMNKREQELYNKEQEELASIRAKKEQVSRKEEAAAKKKAEERQKRKEEFVGGIRNAVSKGAAYGKESVSKAAKASEPHLSAAQQAVKDRIQKEREDINSLMRAGRQQRDTEEAPVSFESIPPVRTKADEWDSYSSVVKNIFTVAVRAKSSNPAMAKRQYELGKLSEHDVKVVKGLLNMVAEFNMAQKQGEHVISHHLRSHDTIDELPSDVLKMVRREYNVIGPEQKKHVRSFDELEQPNQEDMFENMDFMSQAERMQELEVAFDEDVNNPKYQRMIDNTREQARRESATFKMIQKMVMGSITKYYDTKLKPNDIKNMLSKHVIGKHRISTGVFNKVRAFFRGQTERADFQIGYSIDDRLFYEIWQITQANPDYDGDRVLNKTITGLYLFDVTAGTPRLVRGSMPYLRNAEQALLQVAGVVG